MISTPEKVVPEDIEDPVADPDPDVPGPTVQAELDVNGEPVLVNVLAEPLIDSERLMLEDLTCWQCDGRGDDDCSLCKGAGVLDTSKKPLYNVSEMASFFFARSSHWVRWLETCHYTRGEGKKKKSCSLLPAAHTARQRRAHQHTWKFMLDGELLLPIRTESNARKYDLVLVEKIAHALASNGVIQGDQLRRTLLLVRIQAEMFGYLPPAL